MSRFADFWRSLWLDFLDFWKTQVFWAALLSLVAVLVQRFGRWTALRHTTWALLLPYLVIVALFLISNVGRTIYREEKQSFRRKELLEKRLIILETKARQAALLPQPNIQFRRAYQGTIFVGHELSGDSHKACLVEIGNELANGTKGADARDLKIHLVYKDSKTKKLLRTECPARWNSDTPRHLNIPVGEGRSFVLAVFDLRKATWLSSVYSGMEMKGSFDVEAKVLSPDGDPLGETLNFTFQWNGNYENPPDFRRV